MRLAHLVFLMLAGPLLAAENLLPNGSFEVLDGGGWPQGWTRYQWGQDGAAVEHRLDPLQAHGGRVCVQSTNRDALARAGVYTHARLAAGSWALSFWAKAAPGRPGTVRCYLASAYSRDFDVTDQWTRVVFRNTLTQSQERAEINVQNTGGVGTVWFDDVSLEASTQPAYTVVPDPRPAGEQPKLLYFDAHLMSWADNAAGWKACGFDGAFISGIYRDLHDDPWSADKDPNTRGEDDQLLQECRAANDRCAAAGVEDNALKVAMYKDFPNPFDDAGWDSITRNFTEAARFARLAHFRCLAIDTEYTAYQFQPTWQGYDLIRYSAEALGAKLRERWETIFVAVVREYPAVDLLTLPEGAIAYGPLYMSMLTGMIDGLIRAGYERGLHLFAESSYQMLSPVALGDFADDVRQSTARKLPEPARRYWLDKCTVALGVWPLGYYRAIKDQDGKFLGWSGKRETFGDRIVGSYADKSENYPITEFRPQLAAARTFSGRYAWIYSHGMSWWQMTAEQAARYQAVSLQPFSASTYQLPTVPNIEDYYRLTAAREAVRLVTE